METSKVWEKPNSLAIGFLFILLVLAQIAEAADGVTKVIISVAGLAVLISFAVFTLGLHRPAKILARLKRWITPPQGTPMQPSPAGAPARAAPAPKKPSSRGRVVGPPPSPPTTPTV